MRLRDLFSPVNNMTTKELNERIASQPKGSFTLLDVRQPSEYENSRIPGSKLIPLPALNDRLKELDPKKAVIAY
ncbi:MAG: rhodanese-like domain-containing protein [Desulfobacterales bacterium]|jgi:rhodanese-related sulfurtransferase